jgi:hypothetical protein
MKDKTKHEEQRRKGKEGKKGKEKEKTDLPSCCSFVNWPLTWFN